MHLRRSHHLEKSADNSFPFLFAKFSLLVDRGILCAPSKPHTLARRDVDWLLHRQANPLANPLASPLKTFWRGALVCQRLAAAAMIPCPVRLAIEAKS